MVKEIRHTGIVVKDLQESLHFYQDLLDFQIVKQMDESGMYLEKLLGLEGAAVTTVKMALPNQNQMIELIKFHSPQIIERCFQINDTGLTHLSLTVDDVASEHLRLKQKGIGFISAPEVSPDGYAKVAFCQAPEGTFIELVEVLLPSPKG